MLIQRNWPIFALTQYLLKIGLKTEVMTFDHLSRVAGRTWYSVLVVALALNGRVNVAKYFPSIVPRYVYYLISQKIKRKLTQKYSLITILYTTVL